MSNQAEKLYCRPQEEPQASNSPTKKVFGRKFLQRIEIKWDHSEFIRKQMSNNFRKFVIKGPKYPKTTYIAQEELPKYGERGIARDMGRKWPKIARKIKFTQKLSLERCYIDFATIPNSWTIQGAKCFSSIKSLCLPRIVQSENLLKNFVLWVKYSKKLKHFSYLGDNDISSSISLDALQKYNKKLVRHLRSLRIQTLKIRDETLDQNAFKTRSDFAKLIIPLDRFEISANFNPKTYCYYNYDIKKIRNGSLTNEMFSLYGLYINIAWLAEEITETSLTSFVSEFHKIQYQLTSQKYLLRSSNLIKRMPFKLYRIFSVNFCKSFNLVSENLFLQRVLKISPFEAIFELKLRIIKAHPKHSNDIANLVAKLLKLKFFYLEMIDFLVSEIYEFVSKVGLSKLKKFEITLKNTAYSYQLELPYEELDSKFLPLLEHSNLEQGLSLSFQLESPKIILSTGLKPVDNNDSWKISISFINILYLAKKDNKGIEKSKIQSIQINPEIPNEKMIKSKKKRAHVFLFLKKFNFDKRETEKIKQIITKLLIEKEYINNKQKVFVDTSKFYRDLLCSIR